MLDQTGVVGLALVTSVATMLFEIMYAQCKNGSQFLVVKQLAQRLY